MYIKNTATSADDFLTKLSGHLTSNNWELLADRVQTTRELFFRNITSGVIIAFKYYSAYNYNTIILNNILSFNSALSFFAQSGSIASSLSNNFPVISTGINLPITYYLSVNDNRVAFVLNISTLFIPAYVGKIYSVVNPAQYPNPIFVGGTYSSSSDQLYIQGNVTSFMFSNKTTTASGSNKIRLENDSWNVAATVDDNVNLSFIFPKNSSGTSTENFDSSEIEVDKILIFNPNGPAGYIDGFVRLFGYGFTATSEFTLDSEDYIVFPEINSVHQSRFFGFKKA